eukprot:jgi/Mesvir1/17935/Mv12990-RA.5
MYSSMHNVPALSGQSADDEKRASSWRVLFSPPAVDPLRSGAIFELLKSPSGKTPAGETGVTVVVPQPTAARDYATVNVSNPSHAHECGGHSTPEASASRATSVSGPSAPTFSPPPARLSNPASSHLQSRHGWLSTRADIPGSPGLFRTAPSVPAGRPPPSAARLASPHGGLASPGSLPHPSAPAAWVKSEAASAIRAKFEQLVKSSPSPKVVERALSEDAGDACARRDVSVKSCDDDPPFLPQDKLGTPIHSSSARESDRTGSLNQGGSAGMAAIPSTAGDRGRRHDRQGGVLADAACQGPTSSGALPSTQRGPMAVAQWVAAASGTTSSGMGMHAQPTTALPGERGGGSASTGLEARRPCAQGSAPGVPAAASLPSFSPPSTASLAGLTLDGGAWPRATSAGAGAPLPPGHDIRHAGGMGMIASQPTAPMVQPLFEPRSGVGVTTAPGDMEASSHTPAAVADRSPCAAGMPARPRARAAHATGADTDAADGDAGRGVPAVLSSELPGGGGAPPVARWSSAVSTAQHMPSGGVGPNGITNGASYVAASSAEPTPGLMPSHASGGPLNAARGAREKGSSEAVAPMADDIVADDIMARKSMTNSIMAGTALPPSEPGDGVGVRWRAPTQDVGGKQGGGMRASFGCPNGALAVPGALPPVVSQAHEPSMIMLAVAGGDGHGGRGMRRDSAAPVTSHPVGAPPADGPSEPRPSSAQVAAQVPSGATAARPSASITRANHAVGGAAGVDGPLSAAWLRAAVASTRASRRVPRRGELAAEDEEPGFSAGGSLGGGRDDAGGPCSGGVPSRGGLAAARVREEEDRAVGASVGDAAQERVARAGGVLKSGGSSARVAVGAGVPGGKEDNEGARFRGQGRDGKGKGALTDAGNDAATRTEGGSLAGQKPRRAATPGFRPSVAAATMASRAAVKDLPGQAAAVTDARDSREGNAGNATDTQGDGVSLRRSTRRAHVQPSRGHAHEGVADARDSAGNAATAVVKGTNGEPTKHAGASSTSDAAEGMADSQGVQGRKRKREQTNAHGGDAGAKHEAAGASSEGTDASKAKDGSTGRSEPPGRKQDASASMKKSKPRPGVALPGLQMTRSGRLLLPVLAFWCNQHVSRDVNGTIIKVDPGCNRLMTDGPRFSLDPSVLDPRMWTRQQREESLQQGRATHQARSPVKATTKGRAGERDKGEARGQKHGTVAGDAKASQQKDQEKGQEKGREKRDKEGGKDGKAVDDRGGRRAGQPAGKAKAIQGSSKPSVAPSAGDKGAGARQGGQHAMGGGRGLERGRQPADAGQGGGTGGRFRQGTLQHSGEGAKAGSRAMAQARDAVASDSQGGADGSRKRKASALTAPHQGSTKAGSGKATASDGKAAAAGSSKRGGSNSSKQGGGEPMSPPRRHCVGGMHAGIVGAAAVAAAGMSSPSHGSVGSEQRLAALRVAAMVVEAMEEEVPGKSALDCFTKVYEGHPTPGRPGPTVAAQGAALPPRQPSKAQMSDAEDSGCTGAGIERRGQASQGDGGAAVRGTHKSGGAVRSILKAGPAKRRRLFRQMLEEEAAPSEDAALAQGNDAFSLFLDDDGDEGCGTRAPRVAAVGAVVQGTSTASLVVKSRIRQASGGLTEPAGSSGNQARKAPDGYIDGILLKRQQQERRRGVVGNQGMGSSGGAAGGLGGKGGLKGCNGADVIASVAGRREGDYAGSDSDAEGCADYYFSDDD